MIPFHVSLPAHYLLHHTHETNISWQRKVRKWQETNIGQTEKTIYCNLKKHPKWHSPADKNTNMLQKSPEDYITFPWTWWVIVSSSYNLYLGTAWDWKCPYVSISVGHNQQAYCTNSHYETVPDQTVAALESSLLFKSQKITNIFNIAAQVWRCDDVEHNGAIHS